MSLHNLATVFGPTLLRPSDKESKLPTNPSQPISMTDSWSLEVMSQVRWPLPPGLTQVASVCPSLRPAGGSHRVVQGGCPRFREGLVRGHEAGRSGEDPGHRFFLCTFVGFLRARPTWPSSRGNQISCCERLVSPAGPSGLCWKGLFSEPLSPPALPGRSRCCCTSCNWRPFLPQTARDRASSSPPKSKGPTPPPKWRQNGLGTF